MKITEKLNLINAGKKSALYSAIGGSVILLIFMLTKANVMIGVGLYYIGVAFIINSILLLGILLELILNLRYWAKYITTIIYLVLNIPLCIGFCTIALQFI
ncbi:hypothetical protein [Pedobacter rhizosphaerae]|uniref:Branched-chain amino acid:cation transporter, LIVCS family n=1 Tax=Pedobacter rhizosphaerae TaxID=390241 RepID=A0A1H9SQM4_9SPHI|nr:hypothetical protein [Pedobacter rhizosphaerae]SER87266.1 hypothetical protein SAMN04488023_11927 [Pedobacter rhizosphaerae]